MKTSENIRYHMFRDMLRDIDQFAALLRLLQLMPDFPYQRLRNARLFSVVELVSLLLPILVADRDYRGRFHDGVKKKSGYSSNLSSSSTEKLYAVYCVKYCKLKVKVSPSTSNAHTNSNNSFAYVD